MSLTVHNVQALAMSAFEMREKRLEISRAIKEQLEGAPVGTIIGDDHPDSVSDAFKKTEIGWVKVRAKKNNHSGLSPCQASLTVYSDSMVGSRVCDSPLNYVSSDDATLIRANRK